METQVDPGVETAGETDPNVRLGEERQILFVGFGLGLTIGGIFLLYIVLGAAHLL